MPTEITPEQRIRGLLHDIMCLPDETCAVAVARKWAAEVDATLPAGWRAPGPATEEEVERAARTLNDEEFPDFLWGRLSKGQKRRQRELARAALNAALNQEAGNG